MRRLLRVTQRMVQGGISETTRRCGTPTCACHRDSARRHGPHLYITWRTNGKACSLYVPPQHAAQARQAQADWARFWQIGCALSHLNRQELQRAWKNRRARPHSGKPASKDIRRRRSHD
jgi:hypothetical protein